MKKGFVNFLILAAGTFGISAVAQAQVGAVEVNGSGCPQGSAVIKKIPATSKRPAQIDVRLSQMTVGQNGPSILDRKSCSLAIPIALPKGFGLVAHRSYLRANSKVTSLDKASLSQELFLAGSAVEPSVQLAAASGTQVLVTQNNSVKSACGASVNLRLNVSSTLQKNTTTSTSIVDVTSLGIQYSLVKCK